MAQLQKKFIANNAVDDTKIRLSNNAHMRARNAANNADINVLKVNASDRIEFASVPQSPSDASAANDLVRYSQLATLVEGLKPKQAVAIASTADIDLSVAADPSPIDGYTLLDGDRILLKNQTAPEENGIYDAVDAADPTTWTRSADYNNVSEVPGSYTTSENGTLAQGVVYVTTSSPAVLGTDPIVFVFRAAASYTGGDMITLTGSAFSVDLATVSGLESSNPGNAAGQLRVKLEASNPSIQIDGSNQLGVKLYSGGAIVKNASGVAVNLEASNPSLQISSNELGLKIDAAGALQKGASGVSVKVDAATVKINGSDNLEALKHLEQKITLNGTDITNQYVDLAHAIHGADAANNSASMFVVGGPMQEKAVDYTVSLTGGSGGVTRISFAGDLATAGAAELISGDKLVIAYDYLT